MSSHEADIDAHGGRFLTTRWSLVVSAAGQGDEARRSLEELARAYWYPLYAYVRRRGRPAQDALDLTQGFFLKLLERRDLAAFDPARGRFRSFLLAALQHHLANELDRERALKRGGGAAPLSIDVEEAEGRFHAESRADEEPERAFARTWALALLERALERVAADYARRDQAALFARLRGELSPAGRGAPLAELAAELGLSEGALKVALHRLRGRFRDALRAEVAETVSDPGDLEEEIAALMEALAGR